MQKILPIVVLASVFLGAVPETSEAQQPRPRRPVGFFSSTPDRPPATEVGVHLGVWAFEEGGAEFGLHVTRNQSNWLGIEYGYAHRPAGVRESASGVALVNVRLAFADPSRPTLVFVTAGLGVGSSEHWSFSPMGGVGVQFTPRGHFGEQDSQLMLRAELQFFARGTRLVDRGRLLISFVASFGGRW